MLNISCSRLIIILAALWIGSCLVVKYWTDITHGKICETNQYTEKEKCAEYDGAEFFFRSISHTLDHHEGSVVGLATIALVVVTGFLVRFTYGLMIYTSKLWGSTETLMQKADATARSHERAYVSGGCGRIYAIVDATTGNRVGSRVNATYENYGNTQAVVKEVFMKSCLERDLPITPIFDTPMTINRDVLPPDKSVRPIQNVIMDMTGSEPTALYGRINYLDVFDKSHFFTWGHIFIPITGEHKVINNDAYWQWDKAE